MRKVSRIFLPGSIAGGSAVISTGYSFVSGMPATSFMPHRGQTPGVFELTSRSIGHTNPTPEPCRADRSSFAQESGAPSAQEFCAEGESGKGTSSAHSRAAPRSARMRTMTLYYPSVQGGPSMVAPGHTEYHLCVIMYS